MALGQKRNVAVVPEAQRMLEQLKQEVADEIASSPQTEGKPLQSWYESGYGGEVPSRVWGAVGGNMVRRMIAAAQQSMIQQATHQTQSAFRQSLGEFGPSAPAGQGQTQSYGSADIGSTNPFTVNVPRAD